MRLLFASNNLGKVKEVKQILQDLPYQIISLDDLKTIDPAHASLAQLEVKETGQSYEENALLKASFFAKHTQILTLSEDSGLEVNALDNFPGVMSNRWLVGSAKNRNIALLDKLKNETDRIACFVSVLCLYDPLHHSYDFFKGTVKGKIANRPAGGEGFGYDPIFIPDGYEQTFAQLGSKEKNKISHRRQALEQLQQYLRTMDNYLAVESSKQRVLVN